MPPITQWAQAFPPNAYWKSKNAYSFKTKKSKTGVYVYELSANRPGYFTGKKAASISLLGLVEGATSYPAFLRVTDNGSILMGPEADFIKSIKGSVVLQRYGSLDLGLGNNVIALDGSLELYDNSRVSLLDGSDSITAAGDVFGIRVNAASLSTGPGDDTIKASSPPYRNIPYAASSDTSGIYISSGALETGAGNDIITGLGMSGIVDGVPLNDPELDNGIGFLIKDGGILSTGDGNDIITGGAVNWEGSASITTGEGDDTIESVIFGNNIGTPSLDMGNGIDKVRLRSLSYEVTPIAGGFNISRLGGGFNINAYGVEYVASQYGTWIPLVAGPLDLSV